MTPERRLRDAFTGTDVLGTEGRSALARMLGCAPDRLAGAPLGDLTDRRYRRRLAAAIQGAAQPSSVLAAFGDATLGELVPAAVRLPDASIDAARCPSRLLTPLRDHDSLRWSAVLGLRLADVARWTGVGPCGIAQLLGLTVERSLAGLVAPDAGRSAGSASDDIALLLDYADRTPGCGSLRDSLARLAGDGHPDSVRRSASRLLCGRDGSAAPPSGNATVRGDVLDELVEAAGSPRDQLVFVARELGVAGSPSVEQLCRTLKLSAERIRQLRIRSAERVLAAAAEAPDWVTDLATALRIRIGAAAPVDEVNRALAELAPDLSTATARPLLSWLAGPYRPVRGRARWLAIVPDRLLARTRQALNQDGGVRPAGELSSELANAGVVAAHRDPWLRACGALLVEGMVASSAGTCGDVVERVLFATGRPLTVRELCALLPDGYRAEDVRSALRRQQRFVQTDGHADAFELAEWRQTATTRPAARAGRASPGPERSGPAGLASIDGLAWLRVPVTAEILSGAHHPAPSHLPAQLGLSPGQRRTFASRYGPISIVDDGDPTIETLRPVALASGAGHGDALALGFSTDGAVAVKLLRGEQASAAPELAQEVR